MRTSMLEQWQVGGKHFNYHDHTIFYRDDGKGPTLLCIHGFPTSSWDWHMLWPSLLGQFRLIAPDMIGFGFSHKPRDYQYSILDQATLHEELLCKLGVNCTHILAHDYGDTVAQELLARYEERKKGGNSGLEIASICFLNGGLFPETHRPLLIQKLLMSPLGPIVGSLVSPERFRKSFTAILGSKRQLSSQELADYWSIISANEGLKVSHKIIRYMAERKIYRARWVGALECTQVPLRLINGPLDPISGAHMADRYRELVPNADVIMLSEVGHYPQIEDPNGVLSAFLDFVDNVTV
jgi:pimeloyl-ACP methyl ester carboxylesterase